MFRKTKLSADQPADHRSTGAKLRDVNWPSAQHLYPQTTLKAAYKRVKYRLRVAMAGELCDELATYIANDEAWRGFYQRHPETYHHAVSHLLDRRFGIKRRFETALATLERTRLHLGQERAARIGHGERLLVWRLDDNFHIDLGRNETSGHEGLWAFSLRDAQGRRVYNLSFGFLSGGEILMGSVQGPAANMTDAEEVIRHLTKAAEGLRPAYLLFEAVREAARRWGVGALLGIDPVHHIKGRWNMRARRLKFEYRRFWAEVGGHQRIDGYWQIELIASQREPAEMPSRKRAMYRRRYAMLNQLGEAVDLHLVATDPASDDIQ